MTVDRIDIGFGLTF